MTRDVDTDAAATGADVAARLLRVMLRATAQVEADSLAPNAKPEAYARTAGVVARATSALLALNARAAAMRALPKEASDGQTKEAGVDDKEPSTVVDRPPFGSAGLERSLRNLERNLRPWEEHARRVADAGGPAAGGLGVASG